MPYVISIVPPKTYRQRIASSKDGYSMGRGALHYRQGSRGPDARLGLDGSRHSGLRSLTALYSRHHGTGVLGRCRRLSRGGIRVESLRTLHKRLVDATSPDPESIQGYFELDRYVPHLTLGQTVRGTTPSELKDMRHEGDQVLRPFPVFEATGVRIYQEVENRRDANDTPPFGIDFGRSNRPLFGHGRPFGRLFATFA